MTNLLRVEIRDEISGGRVYEMTGAELTALPNNLLGRLEGALAHLESTLLIIGARVPNAR